MTRFGWNVFAGVGVAGLLVAAPVAQAHGKQSSTTSSAEQSDSSKTSDSPSMEHGTSTGTSADTHHKWAKKKNQLSGKIEKLDKDAQTLTLDSSEKKLKLSDDTRIMKDGARATMADLQEGDQVRASFSGTGDTLSALVIEIVPGATSPGRTSGDTGSSSSSMGSSSTDSSSSMGSGTSGSTGSTGSSTGSTGSSTGATGAETHPQDPVKPSPGDTGTPKTGGTESERTTK